MSDPTDPPTPPTPTPPTPTPRTRHNPLRWVLLYTRGLIFDQHLRRLTMFYVVIAAMVMFFLGDYFVGDWHEHPKRFALYWLVCGWLTILSALLAIYDLLLIRVEHRAMRRILEKKMLGREGTDGNPDEEN